MKWKLTNNHGLFLLITIFAFGHSGGAVVTASNILIIHDDDEKKSDSDSNYPNDVVIALIGNLKMVKPVELS